MGTSSNDIVIPIGKRIIYLFEFTNGTHRSIKEYVSKFRHTPLLFNHS